MSDFAFNLPLNTLSFGQLGVALLRESYKRGNKPKIFPVANKVELGSQPIDSEFAAWLQEGCNKSLPFHRRETPVFKLWHLNGSLESFSKKQALFTFYELDEPTEFELNVARNQDKLLVSSNYSKDVLENEGLDNIEFIPLFFDKHNFKVILNEEGLPKRYFSEDKIVFNIAGKFENRKHHARLIRAWKKRFGFTGASSKENSRYILQCATYNPFLNADQKTCAQLNQQEFNRALGEKVFNIKLLPYMKTNAEYNDFLNSGNIIIAMSGAEGWGLPEFQSVALGKFCVGLNAHSYKDWMTKENSILVEPKGKIEAYDNRFFRKGSPWNQGHIFNFDEDEFIHSCELAIKEVEEKKVNSEGYKLQKTFTIEETFNKIESVMEKL